MALASPAGKVGTVAAQVVSAIAAVELPQGHWMDVIGILLGFVSDQSNTSLRVATLQTIGFTCEALQNVRFNTPPGYHHLIMFVQKPEILSMRSNEILTAVIHGARKEEPSQEVQLAAIQALLNSLEFVRDNFEREVILSSTYMHRMSAETRAGREKLHHAGGLRSNTECRCSCSGRSIRVPCEDHVSVLRQDELLHGARAFRGMLHRFKEPGEY